MDRVDHLRTLTAVIEAGSFTEAARRLGQSKASVSKAIAALEADLGARLLDRSTRHVEPTEVGLRLSQRAKSVVEELDSLADEVAQSSQQAKGTLRVAAPISLGAEAITQLTQAFLEQEPEVDLELELSDRLINFNEGRFDVALRIGQLADSSLIARKLGDATLKLVASPAFIDRKGPLNSVYDLSKVPAILDSNHPNKDRWPFEVSGKDIFVPVRGRVTVNGALHAVAMAKLGLGISLTPSFACADALACGELVEVLPETRSLDRTLYAVYQPGRFTPLKVRRFIDFCVSHFAETDAISGQSSC